MKWAVAGLLLLGIAASISAAMLVTTMNARGKTPANAAAPGEVTILVARTPLLAMTVITDELIEEKLVPRQSVPQKCFTEKTQVLGKVLVAPLVQGQAMTSRCFADGDGVNLAAALPMGMRAMTIGLSNHGGLEGLLFPGARVDVIASFSLRQGAGSPGQAVSTTLLQGVRVLAVENETMSPEVDGDKSKAGKPSRVSGGSKRRMVTLAVDPEQAKALQLADDFGSVSLVMANPRDSKQVDSDPTLLSGGKLAALAKLLERDAAGVPDPERAAPPEPVKPPEPMPVAAPTPVEAPPAPAPPPPKWKVTVIRGVQMQDREFETPAEPTPDTKEPIVGKN